MARPRVWLYDPEKAFRGLRPLQKQHGNADIRTGDAAKKPILLPPTYFISLLKLINVTRPHFHKALSRIWTDMKRKSDGSDNDNPGP
ncbi:hypothetical protein WMY93_001702 [Mugilogobius chulae]|uniref:Uncharacterized protein n=1 Tax=Mugilogobius chulae TaxID=88201 RepID=A0AAW0Q6H9_9GOBI